MDREDDRSIPRIEQTEGPSGQVQSRDPVNQVRILTTTVFPKEIKGGELENNVRLQLRYDGIFPTEFGVTKVINRPDGAVIITIRDRKLREKFESTLIALEYKLADQAYRPFEARIHALPEDTMPHTVEDEVQRKFGASPIRVETFPYSKENTKLKNLQFAVVYCNEELYRKMSTTKGININWQWCRIDAAPRAMKCKKCGMLGHLAKYCMQDEM